jgi:hypothetical protein
METAEHTARYTDSKSIWQALKSGDVQLISLKWLLERGAKKKPLPRRQELPDEAKLSHRQLAEIHSRCKAFPRIAAARQVQAQVMPVIAVSHAWLSKTHPDPKGDNLVVICRALRAAFWDDLMSEVFTDCGVFLDWCSLYQQHGGKAGRTRDEYASFKRALNTTMDLWYSHQMTSVLFVTTLPAAYASVKPYDARGWPSFERSSSQLIKRTKSFGASGWTMCVDTAKVVDGSSGDAGASRQVPFSPVHFAELLESKTFTNGADREIVATLYARVASAVLASTKELVWDNVEVTRGDGVKLTATLELCTHVERLSMRVMGLTDSELVALCGVLNFGTLPMLREIALHDNKLGDEGVSALAAALHRGAMPALSGLALIRNPGVGPVGRATLNAAAGSRDILKVAWT